MSDRSQPSPLPPEPRPAYVAERFSGWFRRSLSALDARPPAPTEDLPALDDWIAAPLTPARVTEAVERAAHAARAQAAASIDPETGGNAVGRALRRVRQRLLMSLIERDVTGRASLEEVCQAMTAFAAATTRVALTQAGAELRERFGRPLDTHGAPQDLLAVGMGKGGADELNVSSDLDLIFVFREEGATEGVTPPGESAPAPASRIASSDFMHRLARRAIALLAEVTSEGFVFRVDTRLRPNGDSGPLVASLPMLEDYFYSQGREWERFAWLKGKVIGDSGLAGAAACTADEQSLASIVTPFVFRRYLDFRAIDALRDLHGMIRSEVSKRDLRANGSIDVKLGRGGIREVEFIAQLFQIVRGGRDRDLRDRRTLQTLATLGERGVLSTDDASALAQAYRLLRRTEHALQYREDAQTHRLPAAPEERALVAEMLGLSATAFEQAIEGARADVQRVFDALLRAAAPDAGSDAAAAPAARPDAAAAPSLLEQSDTLRHRLEALRGSGRYRNAREETRGAIEVLLTRAAALEDVNEAALSRLIDLIETVIGRPAYLTLLSQYPQAQARVMTVLGRAKWAADFLIRHPIVLDELLDGQLLQEADYAAWERGLRQTLALTTHAGAPDVERQMDIVREAHHAQIFRLLFQDIEGQHTVERVSDHLSELADRVLSIAIDHVWPLVRSRHREVPTFAVIAYGRLGGKELGYASDLDLVFVHEDDDERAGEAYAQLAQRLSGWLSARTSAGMLFEIDLRLRPNGNAGLLVTSLDAFTSYQRDSAWVWEHQALTRARFAAGDPEIGARFEAQRRLILAQERDLDVLRREVVAMRQKMHDGHRNRSALFDLKHDSGGMVDIEFLVQFLVLAHAHRHATLLDNAGNIALLARAAQAGLIDPALADQVAAAYRRFRKLQHTLRLNDAQYARVEPDLVAGERAAVRALWGAVLG
ncbi:MAG TPA: bifunctional [glutamate--ammonia ligase]-adenylyl-L-tyrosine phosphorylase/[glutamate--ammonia-ligase] adenylyltransferase [Quisquiliibacterium sp.]|nr:bifunctional [glutamate--ammonia ligase]-adenylyl-L-tyrosine phosphorylase/[glutamate--ammonia-ligase] adenylyltransferase [Quisquiliibacterium sp.]